MNRLSSRNAPLIVAVVLALALVPAAFAGKGGGGGAGGGGGTTGTGSTITGPVMVTDANHNGAPNFGDIVTFSVSTTATSQPYVNLQCFQNGVLVYNTWRGFFAASLDTNWNFGLASGAWTSGSGSCTAWVGMYTKRGFQKLGSDSFAVGA